MEMIAVTKHQGPMGHTAQRVRLLQYRIEDGCEVAGRGIDDLQYLGARGLLSKRLVELDRTLVQLLLGFVQFDSALAELASKVGNDLLRIG
jgi:hypothetical protein